MTVVRAAELHLTPADISRAAAVFGVEATESLGGYENLLLRSLDPPGRVLRLTHTSRRSPEMIEAEFDFMAHLAQNAVEVVAPIRSRRGELVEVVETSTGDQLVVACMTEADGERRPREDWSTANLVSYGSLLGSMHRAASTYAPSRPLRPPWFESLESVGLRDSAVRDPEVFARWTEMTAAAQEVEAGGTDMLIHQDAHLGNLHLSTNGRVTIFDFDDSAYGTPTHDLAIVVFYWMIGIEADPATELRRFLTPFLKGYEEHWRLPPGWPEQVDTFLSLREMVIYWLLAADAPEDKSASEELFLDNRRERLLRGDPYLGLPFAEAL